MQLEIGNKIEVKTPYESYETEIVKVTKTKAIAKNGFMFKRSYIFPYISFFGNFRFTTTHVEIKQ